jgi:hypothetical protein
LRKYYFLSASGFATVRTFSMKSCASGLGARFFKVIIATGWRVPGNSTGKALSPGLLLGGRNEKRGTTVRKRLVATSLLRRVRDRVMRVVRGGSIPLARKAATIPG